MKTPKLLPNWSLNLFRRRSDKRFVELKGLSVVSIIESYKGKHNQLPEGALLELYEAGRLTDIIALAEKIPSKIRRRLSDVNAEGNNLFHLIAAQSERPYYDAAIIIWPIVNKLDCDIPAWLNSPNSNRKNFYSITRERGVNNVLAQLPGRAAINYLPFFDRGQAGMSPPSAGLSAVNPS
jgi:hypothetical protein